MPTVGSGSQVRVTSRERVGSAEPGRQEPLPPAACSSVENYSQGPRPGLTPCICGRDFPCGTTYMGARQTDGQTDRGSWAACRFWPRLSVPYPYPCVHTCTHPHSHVPILVLPTLMDGSSRLARVSLTATVTSRALRLRGNLALTRGAGNGWCCLLGLPGGALGDLLQQRGGPLAPGLSQ